MGLFCRYFYNYCLFCIKTRCLCHNKQFSEYFKANFLVSCNSHRSNLSNEHRRIDLSVGAMASLGGVLAARLAVNNAPIFLCFLIPMVVAFFIGFINGWIVTRFRVLSFIITLAMSTILGGFTFWFTGGATIFENIPKSFKFVGTTNILGVPILSIIMILITILFWFIMRHMSFGRKLYAIGEMK